MENWFQRFNDQHIVVIGDVMVDAYIWGKVSRISPEAPVPIINITKREERPGGAANVALNLNALGASTHIIANVGEDIAGDSFISLLDQQGIYTEGIIRSKNRPTTVKTRIISQGQQMLRVDEESTKYISQQEAETLVNQFKATIAKYPIKALVLEDYNKGLLSEWAISKLIEVANENKIPVTVDPKKDNFFAYKNATLFKPNFKELVEGLKEEIDVSSEDSVHHALESLIARMNIKSAMVTLSEHGVQCFADDYTGRIPAHKREISDVSGAGDTVIAVATLCLAAKLPSVIMCELSNLAGGLVCEEVGVVPIKKDKLLKEAIRVLNA
ncbi:D-glycero-beta-D-manno-heptose-7-phosphate kinase [Luteibaculum oceani]|uniref:D-glycero-beta-D-manno-heptose-7-phosphate kinase n=1 Tax=Luteibaculum oceani TaxID=1294296 RepID=A0A5C6V1G8_9FLAO|nr:D-glycero-beta-D-manno-heptose-7-phosphate kinase [Luteibaculum oceani]